MVSLIVPPVIAHRGASGYAPENTLAAFQKAHALGARWVEFDVMLTQCGEVVIIHDETLDRTTNASGYVANTTYEALKNRDAGSWFHPMFSGEKIPTLSDVLTFLYTSGLRANIELKAKKGQEEHLVKKVYEILQDAWPPGMEPLLFSSFSLMTLRYLRKYNTTAWLGFLMDHWQATWEKTCDELDCMAVNVNHAILNAERVKQIKSTQRLLLAYTVNDESQARHLFMLGVDAIFSDYPDRILNVINS